MTASVAAVVALRVALEETAAALAAADLEGLLACERQLATALHGLPASPGTGERGSAELAATIQAARDTLLRCRRLGNALSDVTRTALEATSTAYSRAGRPSPACTGASVAVRG